FAKLFAATQIVALVFMQGALSVSAAELLQEIPDGNQPPVAVDDSYTADTNQTITFNDFTNDYDPDGDDIDLATVNSPSGGEIVDFDIESGDITYRAPSSAGTYRFDYTITDGRATDVATVTIDVDSQPTNNPPVAVDDFTKTLENTSVTIFALSNDSDPDGDNISIVSFTDPAHGSVIRASGRGDFIYTPDRGFTGNDTFTYTISDGHKGGTDIARVTIEVNKVTPG